MPGLARSSCRCPLACRHPCQPASPPHTRPPTFVDGSQVSAIDTCLREPPGKLKCSVVQGEFGEDGTSGAFGKFFGGK